jgi:hypothetical protein
MNELEQRLDVAVRILRDANISFWIAGGYAIDLFVGEVTRAHDDIDIQILRGDEHALAAHLIGWDLRLARDGELEPWRVTRDASSQDPRTESTAPLELRELDHAVAVQRAEISARRGNAIWCRESADATWAFELLMADVVDGQWLYRRDPRITRSLDEIGSTTESGIPFMRPEIQLLFKSKNVRPKDEADFRAAVPRMDPDARSWLAGALGTVAPTHAWLSALALKR